MNKTVNVKVNGEAILSKVSRMFDNSPNSILLELAQNARRAGATKINVDVRDKDKFIMWHDGEPLSDKDFTAMFSLGDSGWEEDGTKNEDPAGCGFFIATIFDSIKVESRVDDYRVNTVTARRDDLMKEGTKLKMVEELNHLADWKVKLTLTKKDHAITYKHVESINKHFPIRITADYNDYIDPYHHDCKEQKLNEPTIFEILNTIPPEKIEVDEVRHGVRFRIITDPSVWQYEGKDVHSKFFERRCNYYSSNWNRDIYFNFHGHHVWDPFEDNLNSSIRSVLHAIEKPSRTVVIITPEKDSELRMLLPARSCIVKNNAYKQIQLDMYEIMVEMINKAPAHTLKYDMYNYFGGKKRLNKEATIPEELANLDEDQMVMQTQNLNVGIEYALDNYDSYKLKQFSGLSEYKGYTWYDKLNIVEQSSMYLFVDDDYICVESNEPLNDNITAGSIDIVIIKDVPTDRDPTREDGVIICSPDLCYLNEWDEQWTGDCIPGVCFYLVEGTINPSGAVNIMTEHITKVWQVSDDCEADSPDTQFANFEEELAITLYNIFIPDKAVEQQFISFISKGYYNLPDNMDSIIFELKDGTKYKAHGDSLHSPEITKMED